MSAILRIEVLKLRTSLVGIVGTIAVVGGIAVLSGAMLLAASSGQPDLIAKLGPAATADWQGYLSAAAQITGAGGLLGCGIVLAWMFGREFTDQTVSALFALPVGRGRIAAGKLAAFAMWSAATALGLAAALLVVGLIAGLGAPSPETWAGLIRQAVLVLLTCAIATPVAWITTLARSTLGGVAATIVIVVIAQVGVLAGAGGWMPFAAPTLWVMSAGSSITPVQLALVVVVGAASSVLVITAWRRLQLDR
jgi:ABC-2 type transport system permease protein